MLVKGNGARRRPPAAFSRLPQEGGGSLGGGVLIPTTALALFCICTIKASLICFHLKGGKLAKNTV